MGELLRSIIAGIACALCTGALADERVDPQDNHPPAALGDARALDDERLDELRGRLALPPHMPQPGVVLWDEPHKGAPPVRTSASSTDSSQISTSVTIKAK